MRNVPHQVFSILINDHLVLLFFFTRNEIQLYIRGKFTGWFSKVSSLQLETQIRNVTARQKGLIKVKDSDKFCAFGISLGVLEIIQRDFSHFYAQVRPIYSIKHVYPSIFSNYVYITSMLCHRVS